VQLVTPDPSESQSWFESLENIQTLMGIGSVIAAAAGPAVAAIGLSAMFIRLIARVYQKTPEVLRCLMGYIVDLTLVMDQLFLQTLAIKPPRQLTSDQVDMALETYKMSEMVIVHRDIRNYANQATFQNILQSNKAQEKVIQLIKDHRTK